MTRTGLKRVLAPALALALVAAACGGDDDDDEGAAPTEVEAEPTEAPGDTEAADGTDLAPETSAPEDTEETEETSAAGGGEGEGAGGAVPPGGDGSADLGPFTLGVINSNELFPDYSAAMEAAVAYANAELNGLEGRDIEMQVCTIEYNTPDDTQRCANELAAAQVDLVISTLNQFGSHMQILRGAGIPVIVGTPVSIPDYTTEGVYAIGPGGGCAGVLTGMSKYAVEELEATRIAIPYYDIPSGVLCYADSEQKPIDVLKGTVEGATAADAGTAPDVERQGIPVPPTDPDLTSVANQILAFEPDAIIFSGPATACFPLLAAMNAVGYSIDEIPLIFTTSCWDQAAAEDAGDNAVGLYVVGALGYLTQDPATLEGAQAEEATIYQEKSVEYGMDEEFVDRGFAQAGFTLIMSMVQRAAEVAANGDQVDGQTLAEAFAATENSPQFGSTPISCASAGPPYSTICNRIVSVNQWDGSIQETLIAEYDAMDLHDGTEIRTEPLN